MNANEIIGVIGVIVMLILLLHRVPISFTFFIVGFVGIWVTKSLTAAINTVGTTPFQTMQQSGWTVVPLFVLMGFLTQYSGFASGFFEGVRRWIGHFKGGLLYSIIVANTAFGACCGSTTAAIVTFQSICLPETRKYNYDDKITLGCIASTSVLSALVPPSLLFVIYAMLTSTSVLNLFMAGLLPGILLAILFGVVVFIWTRFNPSIAPSIKKATMKERLQGTPGMAGIMLLFIAIILGMYFGIVTPSEAGGAGCVVIFLMSLIKRTMTFAKLKNALMDTVTTVCMIGMLVVGANVFNVFLSITGVPQLVASVLTGLTDSSIGVMMIVVVLYVILGCFLDVTAAVILTLPMFYPAITAAGWDPIHFGVIIVFVLVIGGISPPFGMSVFTLAGASKVASGKIFRGVIPFLAAMLICTLIVIFIPELSVWLPSTMYGS